MLKNYNQEKITQTNNYVDLPFLSQDLYFCNTNENHGKIAKKPTNILFT